MKNSKTTRRALFSSVAALLLCFTMLLGTTFAWFTDTASTSVNTIQAGTLKVDIVNSDGQSLVGNSLAFHDANNNTSILWEPGATFKTYTFSVKNDGNLALKYKVTLNGVDGDAKLLEVIDFKIVDKEGNAVDLANFEGHLTAGNTSDTYCIEGTMKTAAGNGYQGLKIDGVSITVYATQDTVEYDSTGNTYDEKAEYSTADTKTTAMLITAGNLTINKELSINSDETNGNSEVIRVTGGEHTIIGGSYTAYGTKSNSALRVDGGTVTITGGNFEAKEDNNCIYAAGGNIIIEGGSFKSEKEFDGHYWVLNCKDNSGSVITVKGGSFYKFDPSNANTGEGEIVVADGYKVVQNNDWYTVVANTSTGE